MNLNCAHCKKLLESSGEICDNDCSTVYCTNCGGENYYDSENKICLPVHDSNCGEDSE